MVDAGSGEVRMKAEGAKNAKENGTRLARVWWKVDPRPDV